MFRLNTMICSLTALCFVASLQAQSFANLQTGHTPQGVTAMNIYAQNGGVGEQSPQNTPLTRCDCFSADGGTQSDCRSIRENYVNYMRNQQQGATHVGQ